ncbi:MAG: hypothetical protein KA746_01755 [Pyrinomonadaceae bacterium]|nr:hypothetical protein [Pyrinomonadaceae bacterium]MBP6211664.1 hypothetical protein [Pyrinomonadaceae bacterium]
MKENFIKPIESFASSVMDGLTGFFGNGGSELRDPPTDGRVTLPADLFAQPDVQTEWWYYTGHCTTRTGRKFGFELVFFKRRTDRDKIGVVPMNMVANPMYFAHFAISDVTVGQFKYEHIRSFGNPLELPVVMSPTACDVQLGPWSLREIAGKHVLHATLEDGLTFDAILEPAKPIVLNGDGGITRKKDGASKHFSYTRMNVSGQLNEGGAVETFSGSAWMDREFGSWEQGNWDWFSIQFDDETELMIYTFTDDSGEFNGETTGTYVDRDGNCRYLKRSDFNIEITDKWLSPNTGAEYPAKWLVSVPTLGIEAEIVPLIVDQELDTRGSTMIVYWEGACSVKGTKAGTAVGGNAYVELVGYDRSHETAGIGDFLFGHRIRQAIEMFS